MKKNFFLDHPVFSIVISIVVVILGCIGLAMLPVDQYPRIVPPVVKVPDIAVPEAKPAARPTVPEVVPAAPRTSVADLVDPLPEPPREPDFSGFERLVDSSYVPPAPASSAGDTAEIPVVRDEYVPRARNYTLGLSPREQKKRDREQRRLERQFAKAQQKEEARRIREEARAAAEVAREERKAAAAAAREERLAAAAAAREERKAAEVAHAPEADEALAAGAMLAATEAAAAEMAAASEQADGAEPAPAAPDATAALKPGALELPAAETGIVPVGERAIASTAEAEDNCAKMAVEEVMAYLERGEKIHCVNM